MALAKAVVEPVADNPAGTPLLNQDASTPVKDGMIATWLGQSVFLLVVAGYAAAILALTARRPRMAPGTLTVGSPAGLALGAVMYLIAPLGLTNQATDPRLPALAVNLLVALAWILLFGGPGLAGLAAVRRYRRRDSTEEASADRQCARRPLPADPGVLPDHRAARGAVRRRPCRTARPGARRRP
jgi:hypothetical protein